MISAALYINALQISNDQSNTALHPTHNIQEIDHLNQLIPPGEPEPSSWEVIAEHFPGRNAKQCRERYFQHSRGERKKRGWTDAEGTMISKLHEMYGKKWTFIASKMPGRSGNDVKVRGAMV
jgi:hypothetical protein